MDSVLVNKFLDYLENQQHVSAYTLKSYKHHLRDFLEFNKGRDLSLEVLNSYKLHLSRKGLNHKSKNHYLITLRSFLKYLNSIGIETFESSNISLDKVPYSPKNGVDLTSLDELISSPDLGDKDGLRDKTILSLLSSTPIKVSELALLDVTSVNLVTHLLKIKGKKSRVVKLSDQTVYILDQYLKSRSDHSMALFIRFKGTVDSEGSEMRLGVRSIERLVKKHSKRIGSSKAITPQAMMNTISSFHPADQR